MGAANDTLHYNSDDWDPNCLVSYLQCDTNGSRKRKLKTISKYVKSVMTKVAICNEDGASQLLLRYSETKSGCKVLRQSGATQLLAQFYALRGAENKEWLNNADLTLDNLAKFNDHVVSRWKELVVLKALKLIWLYSRHDCSHSPYGRCSSYKIILLEGLEKLQCLLKHESYCKTILKMGALVSVAVLLEIGSEVSEIERECSFGDDVIIKICDILSDVLTIQKTGNSEQAEACRYLISIICNMPRVPAALCGHLKSKNSDLVLAAIKLVERLACVPSEQNLSAIGKSAIVPVLTAASIQTPGRPAFNALFCLMLGYPGAKEEFLSVDLSVQKFFKFLQTNKSGPEAKVLSGILLSISEKVQGSSQCEEFCGGAIDEKFLKLLHSPSKKVVRHVLGILSTICTMSYENTKQLVEINAFDRLLEMKHFNDQVIFNARSWLLLEFMTMRETLSTLKLSEKMNFARSISSAQNEFCD